MPRKALTTRRPRRAGDGADGSSKVGFLGLGAIGSELALSLVEAGIELVVFDVRPEAMEPLLAAGAIPAGSVAEVAAAAETVMVSLPTPDAVLEVVRGGGGLLDAGSPKTFVDLSTIGLRTAQELAVLLAERGVAYIDAPVSGGVAGAKARSLAVFVAAEPAAYQRAKALLEPFAKTIVHVGAEPGQGQLAKLLNNLLSATAMAITCEALTVGVRAGLDPEALLEAFNAGSGRNTATASKFPQQIVNRRFDSGFRLELMLKDVRLALEEARAQGVEMQVGDSVEQVWLAAMATLERDSDHTEVVRFFEQQAGVTVAARRDL